MSGAMHRILPLEDQARRLPLQPRDLDRLFEVADLTRFGGVAGLPGKEYAGQGYTEVPSQWLCEIIVRLKAAEATAAVRSRERGRMPESVWQSVLDRLVVDEDVPDGSGPERPA